MDPEIRNFDTIEDFIRQNPQKAQGYVSYWITFRKGHPEAPAETVGEFIQWATENGVSDPNDIYACKEIYEAYSLVRPQDQPLPESLPPPSNPTEIFSLATPLMFLLQEPTDLMEDNAAYKKIEKKKKQEWLKNNPGKDFSSKEGLDYIYGPLETDDISALARETEKEFRDKNPKTAKKYDERKKRIYKDDPAFLDSLQRANDHADARLELFKKENPKSPKADLKNKRDDLLKQTTEKEFDRFTQQYTQKATAYAKQNPKIAAALHRKNVRNTKQALSQYQSTTGKEVKYVEKTHTAAPAISQEEVASRLQSLSDRLQTKSQEAPSGLMDAYGRPLPSTLPSNQQLYNPNQLAKKNSFWQEWWDNLRKKPKKEHKEENKQAPPPPRRQPSPFTRTIGRGFQAVNIAANPRAAAGLFIANQAVRQAKKGFLKLEMQLAKFAAQLASRIASVGIGWIPIGVIVSLIIIVIILTIVFAGGPTTGSPTPATLPIPGFTLSPSTTAVASGTTTITIAYTHDPSSPVPLSKITVSLTISSPLVFAGATGSPVCEPGPGCDVSTTKVIWSLSDPANKSPLSITFENPTTNKVDVTIEANVVP